jgi:uncharacterized membrane protein YdjX (TVP38/TMEM64 family)
MKVRDIDLRIWLLRLGLIGAAAAAYYLAVHLGWAPANPIAWLFEIGDRVKDELPKFGILAPIVYALFYALQIVIAPIPGAPLAYTAGYLFGPVVASIFSMLGIMLGAAIAFWLARRLGWPLIEKMAPKSWIERWRNLAAVNSSITWFLLMLAPTADVFYFIAGLTTLSFRRFMLLVFLGRLPGIILSSIVGANVESFGAQWIVILIAALLLISLAGNWLRQRVENRALLVAETVEVEE